MNQEKKEEIAEDLKFLLEKAETVYFETGTIDNELKKECINFLKSIPNSEEAVAEFRYNFGDPEATGDVGARGNFSLAVKYEEVKKSMFKLTTNLLGFDVEIVITKDQYKKVDISLGTN